jgi:hypothetical protein
MSDMNEDYYLDAHMEDRISGYYGNEDPGGDWEGHDWGWWLEDEEGYGED